MPDRGTSFAPRFGLFRLPDDLKPGELKRIRQGDPLPESHRGFVSAHETRGEAHDAWREGLFVREIEE